MCDIKLKNIIFAVTGQKVSIKGTVEEIKKAKELILLKLEEDGHGKFIAEQNRKNRPAQNLMHQTLESSNVETLDWCTDFVEVYVSALKNPGDFYLQVGILN
jgi:flagellar basal body rod protein FlgG